MSGTKVLLVVLVVIVVAFIVLTVMGVKTNKSDSSTTADNFNSSSYSLTSSLGPVLAKFGPKLSANQMKPSATSFNLQTKPTYVVSVGADSSNQFRTAKFVIQPASGTPCASISYQASSPPKNTPSTITNQSSTADGNSTKHQISITVLSGGGTITVARRSSVAPVGCLVSLQ